MVNRFSDSLIQKRALVLLAILAITGFFLFEMRHLNISHDLSTIAPQKHPYVKLQREMERDFGGTNLVSIGLVVDEGDIFDKNTLAKVYRITEGLKELRGVVPYRILSIASRKLKYVYTTIDPDGIESIHAIPFETLAEKAINGDKESLETIKSAISRDEFIYGPIVSKDKKGTIIQADFQWEWDYPYIFKEVKRLTQKEQDENTHFHICGRPIELGYLHQYLNRIEHVFGLGLLCMIALLFLFFKTKRGTILPTVSALMTVIWGLGIMGLFKTPLDIMSITVPFLILAIAVSHAVQIIKRYYEEYAHLGENKAACNATITELLRTASGAMVTDSAGFLALVVFPFPAMRSMALVATVSILCIFFTTFLFIPLALSFLPPPKRMEMEREERWGILDRIAGRITALALGSRKWVVVLITAIVIAIGVVGSTRFEVGDLQEGSPIFWASSPYNQDLRILNSKFPGIEPYYISIKGKEEGAICDPKLLAEIDVLEKHLRQDPKVGYVNSYVDVLKRMNFAWRRDPKYLKIPESEPLAWQFLDIFMAGGGDAEDTRSYFTRDYSRANISVLLKDHTRSTIKRIIGVTDNFTSKSQGNPVSITQAAGNIGIFAAIMEELESNQLLNLIIIGVIVFVDCFITFRFASSGLIVLSILAISLLVTSGIMGFGKIGLFISTAVIASLGTGIGDNFPMYTLGRLIEEYRKDPNDYHVLHKTLTTSGKAVFFTAMSVILGSLVLVFSGLRIQALMGGMLAIAFLANMLATLVVLPTFVTIFKPRSIYGSSQ